MIKILVADNHPIVRKGIHTLFKSSSEIEVIANVGDTEELFDFLTTLSPDVIVMELNIPKINGIAALRKLKEKYPHIKILIFSSQPEDVYALTTIKAGASGYLSKSADILKLKEAIIKIMNGGNFITNELAQRLAFDETKKQRRYFRKLSTREVEVLKLLANGKRNKYVAQELGLNEKTVSTYKARLMRKLNVDNLVDMLQQAKALELY